MNRLKKGIEAAKLYENGLFLSNEEIDIPISSVRSEFSVFAFIVIRPGIECHISGPQRRGVVDRVPARPPIHF